MRDDPRVDDRALLSRLRAGDAQAFEEMVIAYQHRVFGVALRMLGRRAEAEEVAQEAFLRAHRSVAGFRGDAKLSTWLYAITSRLCLNRLASAHHRRVRHDDEALARVADDAASATDHLERREREAAVHRAIAELGDERRLVIVLCDLEGLTYEEIAGALELPVGTVRSRLHRARMELREKLEKAL
ncbi:MAG: sigma-70 family RNA polymerase sigma factor [Candidatus Rokubacteria bacterium]|nr:sigma-70 family RNA polymerase sigma factor [Candidatus Rokubacteria bacterium]